MDALKAIDKLLKEEQVRHDKMIIRLRVKKEEQLEAIGKTITDEMVKTKEKELAECKKLLEMYKKHKGYCSHIWSHTKSDNMIEIENMFVKCVKCRVCRTVSMDQKARLKGDTNFGLTIEEHEKMVSDEKINIILLDRKKCGIWMMIDDNIMKSIFIMSELIK